MSDKIPVSFEHNGKKTNGHLDKVSGAGDSSTWHLMGNDKFYYGALRRHNDQWVFDPTPKTEDLKDLADFFGDVVTAWYE